MSNQPCRFSVPVPFMPVDPLKRKITCSSFLRKFSMFLAAVLVFFAPVRADDIRFDRELTGWKKSYPPGVGLDSQVKVSESGSLRLTANQSKDYVDTIRELALEPKKDYVISFMVKGENIADKRTGIFFNFGKNWDRGARWSGSFDWTKCTCELNTGKIGGSKVMLHFTLFGKTGKLWIDQLSITPKDADKTTRYSVNFYPVNRENNCMTVCENLPVILLVQAAAPAKYKEHYRHKTSRLTMDVPKFLKLKGSRTGSQSGWFSFYNYVNPMTVDKTFTRDGIDYQRYFVDYDRYLALFMCVVPYLYNFQLLFEPAPGSAGKTAKVYWSFDIGGEKYPEHFFTAKVLPSARMTEPPCREFRLATFRDYVVNHSGVSQTGIGNTMKFWDSLTASTVYSLPNPVSHIKKQHGDTLRLGLSQTDCQSALTRDEFSKMKKLLPMDVSLKGKVSDHITTWALLEDPDKIFENYLRTLFRKVKAHKPAVKILSWDIEPFGFGMEGCDEGGRKRFAQKMNLKTVPTLEELNGKYREVHFQYMLKLYTELIRKVVRIMREELPGVEMWICSGNLTVRPPHYARWACVDIRTIDDIIDVHYNMPYYTGTQFFDDMKYNVEHLKKPNFPIHYPSYVLPSFNYTPKRLLQNIVASAALGCIGAGLGESDILSGEYQQSLAKTFSMISRAEKFYFHGQRCDNEITVMPKNAVSRKLPNGKTITWPDFTHVIRYTAHKLNGKYLITLLNYHQTLPLIAEISGKDFKPFLVKVEPEGCEQIGTGMIPPQKPLQQEIAGYSGSSDTFRDYIAGQNKAVWTAAKSGKSLIQLSDGKITAGVDAAETGEVISLQTAAGKELVNEDGFIGRIMFFKDRLQPKPVWKTERHGLEKDNAPYQISSVEIGPYEGAIPDPNPLQGMKIRRKFTVRNGKLLVSFEFINPTDREMPLALRLNNHPWPGFRFDAKNIVLNGKYDISAPSILTLPADGTALSLKAAEKGLTDEIIFQAATKFEQYFIWTNRLNSRKTVEFLLDRKLAPGTSLKAEYEVTVK